MTKFITGTVLASLLLISCTKETQTYSTENIHDYFPLAVGKYITYQLDSTLFIHFGARDTVVSYQVKDVVDAQITDNLGRSGYRIIRYIRQDTSQAWQPNNTFEAVPTTNSIEYVENNLRFLKLEMPIRQDFSWKGNSYIDTYSVNSNVTYLDDWDYIYDSLDQPLTINGINFDKTLKVAERNDSVGDPNDPATVYAEKTFSEEKYASGVGLIYRDFLHWEYQNCGGCPDQGYSGYGVRLSIIDHN